jgi:NAD(P)-dependent dehydrogenase (short-subunit alcohol dehydrogenase family)
VQVRAEPRIAQVGYLNPACLIGKLIPRNHLTAMAKNLAFELAKDRIRINTIAPGIVPTPLHGELTPETLNSLDRQHPLGRVGTPKDIADAVLYLANASWVTGVILPVDGGIAAGGDGFNNYQQAA